MVEGKVCAVIADKSLGFGGAIFDNAVGYVKMYSPDGFMQGYGIRSDDRARNSILLRPFNGYAVTVKDTTVVMIDSVNFIGPLIRK